jgi:hypothetical protein
LPLGRTGALVAPTEGLVALLLLLLLLLLLVLVALLSWPLVLPAAVSSLGGRRVLGGCILPRLVPAPVVC